MKKIILLTFAVILLFSLVCVPVFAASSDGQIDRNDIPESIQQLTEIDIACMFIYVIGFIPVAISLIIFLVRLGKFLSLKKKIKAANEEYEMLMQDKGIDGGLD